MSLVKILSINLVVLISLVTFLEISSATLRYSIGKEVYVPNVFLSKNDINDPRHPCNEQKTDVLLDHISNHGNKCPIKGGQALGEYVVYDASKSNKPIILTLGGSTTAGFYQNISNGETWPKILSEKLWQEYRVINGGVGGYGSLQELLKFMKDGPRFQKLAIVISLNGINELKDYHGDEQERMFNYPFLTNVQMQMNESQVWVDQRVS